MLLTSRRIVTSGAGVVLRCILLPIPRYVYTFRVCVQHGHEGVLHRGIGGNMLPHGCQVQGEQCSFLRIRFLIGPASMPFLVHLSSAGCKR